jgi:tripartite-type tricarboxylate transporter receptor subunit TctC
MKRLAPIVVSAACVACLMVPFSVDAQSYPTKPIRTIMTVSGGLDVVARLVAQGLTESLGQPVLVESQSGAGGAIGAETVAHAAPDGYTLMLSGVSTLVLRRYLVKNVTYDTVRDFSPIAQVVDSVAAIVSNPSLPVNSIKELIEYARRNPGKLSYGTSGIGTTHHLSAEAIKQLTSIEWVHVPYKGGPPVLTDLMSGQIQVGFSILATMTPFMNSGKIKILAVNNAKRYSVIPDVPTVSEQLAGYERPPGWNAYFGPAGLPQAFVNRLNAEMVKTMNIADVRAKSQNIGFVAATGTPEDLAEMVKRDIASVGKLVKAIGIQPE